MYSAHRNSFIPCWYHNLPYPTRYQYRLYIHGSKIYSPRQFHARTRYKHSGRKERRKERKNEMYTRIINKYIRVLEYVFFFFFFRFNLAEISATTRKHQLPTKFVKKSSFPIKVKFGGGNPEDKKENMDISFIAQFATHFFQSFS